MLDFLFGGTRKLEIIRELLEQRMNDLGFGDMESRLKIKQMGNTALIGTPEGTLVTIIESIIKMQRQGLLLWQILEALENHRKRTGHDGWTFVQISSLSRKSPEEASNAIPMYARYRINMEHAGLMSDEQFESAFLQAVHALTP